MIRRLRREEKPVDRHGPLRQRSQDGSPSPDHPGPGGRDATCRVGSDSAVFQIDGLPSRWQLQEEEAGRRVRRAQQEVVPIGGGRRAGAAVRVGVDEPARTRLGAQHLELRAPVVGGQRPPGTARSRLLGASVAETGPFRLQVPSPDAGESSPEQGSHYPEARGAESYAERRRGARLRR